MLKANKKPDGKDRALVSIDWRIELNKQILTEIEMNRKIYLFQKAVERYATEKTVANSQAVAQAKIELCKFAMQVML
ncbi:hypothetical protein HXZ60_02055 [Acinetobacter towneri]|uniref:hypothetical protein n=1 Tax=Acinetobacter towneri TaxID=202956 RepID=UPI00257896FC|nr:hypothetical protein [Acinetobacter towneri]MDM1282384.1 hypothetical protein [Acinetobacter towneri]